MDESNGKLTGSWLSKIIGEFEEGNVGSCWTRRRRTAEGIAFTQAELYCGRRDSPVCQEHSLLVCNGHLPGLSSAIIEFE